MTFEHHEPPHDPAPPEPRRLIPEWPFVVRGTLLAVVAVAGLLGSRMLAKQSAWLLPLAAGSGLAALLAAWAAAIQLTGGQQQDDHPWV